MKTLGNLKVCFQHMPRVLVRYSSQNGSMDNQA